MRTKTISLAWLVPCWIAVGLLNGILACTTFDPAQITTEQAYALGLLWAMSVPGFFVSVFGFTEIGREVVEAGWMLLRQRQAAHK